MKPPSAGTVRNVVAATALLTLFHFTDNAVAIDSYPAPSWQPSWFWVVVAVSWPVFTALGILGYRSYKRGELRKAHACLFFYSYSGLVSLGHFAYGGPGELTTRGTVSVFVDAVAGATVLAITLWSVLAHRSAAAQRA